MKILLSIILGLGLISGCYTENKTDYYVPCERTYNYSNSDFNKESYVWESFIFPTNKVEIR